MSNQINMSHSNVSCSVKIRWLQGCVESTKKNNPELRKKNETIWAVTCEKRSYFHMRATEDQISLAESLAQPLPPPLLHRHHTHEP